MAAVWARADLLVHTSKSETYGMVISEALARGVPSIVASGTGAVEAQRAGRAQHTGGSFAPGDAGALADVLRLWLTDPHLQERWRASAVKSRNQLPTWEDAARIVAGALSG